MGETKSAEIIPFPGRSARASTMRAATTPPAAFADERMRISHVLEDLGAALEYQKEAIAAWRDRLTTLQIALCTAPSQGDPARNGLPALCLPAPGFRSHAEALTRWAEEVPDETAT